VVAHAVVESTLAGLAALREVSGPVAGRDIPARFLRYADEQTVVGLTAVLRAMERFGGEVPCLDEWGVLAAPRFPGRIGGAAAQVKYRQGGPSTISPHVIPQCSLHSLSSAISIALAMRGPNLGVGGGPEALAEGFAAAAGFLGCGMVPGLWLVLTGWDPEAAPDGHGSITNEAVCRGVALALAPGNRPTDPLRWTISPWGDGGSDPPGQPDDAAPAASLTALAQWLAADADPARAGPWSCGLPWGGRIELTRRAEQPAYGLPSLGLLKAA
jgi:hypothetical protein